MEIHIYLDKQTISFLVAFFTGTCHVILMKTIAYVTVTLNKNIIERHELFDSLFSTIIIMHQSIETPTPWVSGKGRGFDSDPGQKASTSLLPEAGVQIKRPYP